MTTKATLTFPNQFELRADGIPVILIDADYSAKNHDVLQIIAQLLKLGLYLSYSADPVPDPEPFALRALQTPKPAAKAKASAIKPKPAINSELYPNDSKVYLNWKRLSTDEKLHLSQYRTTQDIVLSTTRQSHRSVDFDNNVMELTTRQLATTPGID